MTIEMIVAQAKNRVIGGENKMLWHIPEDFAHFKKVTMGCPIIMGRLTHESIGRALPGRMNIVVTRNPEYQAQGCTVVHSLDEALKLVENQDKCFVIGGGQLFKEALGKTQRIWLTLVDKEFEGDTLFPQLDESQWKETILDTLPSNEKRDYPVIFKIYDRI